MMKNAINLCVVSLLVFWAFSPSLAGEPTIEFTSIPSYGSFEDLTGQVWNVDPLDCKVAVYIYVAGWWTKPYWSHPLTTIYGDGNWMCDITTGGIDQNATKIAAFLVPNGYDPLLMSGGQTLPSELYQNSVAHIEVERPAILRTITFSGYDWKVKSCETPAGPGPNYFSDREEDVWVDEAGQLHLKITKRNGWWYCTEAFTEASLGYGKYIFYVAGRVDQLDKNIVLGLFTWDETASEYNYREIDIEFSRWGEETNDNAQYVVQPWDRPGNMKRFNIEVDDEYTTHIFNWTPDSIFFQSLHGHYPSAPAEDYIIESWTYTGNDIPPAGKENVRINLWLYKGNPPTDAEEAEIVIKAFQFIPHCRGDLDTDGDVDGSDLAVFAVGGGGSIALEEFAAEFGRTDCP